MVAAPLRGHAVRPAERVGRLVLLATVLLIPGGAWAADTSAAPEPAGQRALFALILGVNASLRGDVPPLRYADDDAARYLDLFRALGARTYLLSRLDANTRRLHPQAAAESIPPRRTELEQTVTGLAQDIAHARARGVQSTLYVVYAGHGDVDDAGWWLTLEDGRLGGQELITRVVERARAEQSHVILDACHAYLLALPRGPGGTRRPVAGFVDLAAAAQSARIGFLLSSSVSGESHEWAGFEAGVFSHEVRSGLYGAADADGDGRVTYAEIGAFVARANQPIENDRFRPRALARGPRDGDLLLDLRGHRERELRLDAGSSGAHYLLEDRRGVRLLDFHGTGRDPVRLIRPAGEGSLFLRRLADGAERTIPAADGPVDMDRLAVGPARTEARGAANHAFGQIFGLAFDATAVTQWSARAVREEADLQAEESARQDDARHARQRRIGAVAALGVALAAGLGAGALEISAHRQHDDALPDESHRDTVERNERIRTLNLAAGVAGATAFLAAGAGVLLLLWPRRDPAAVLDVALGSRGGEVSASWNF